MKTKNLLLMAGFFLLGIGKMNAQNNAVLNTATSTPGLENVVVGVNAVGSGGTTPSTNYRNVFVGFSAGLNNVTGLNTFVGYAAGMANTTGDYNTFLGFQAGVSNQTGRLNTFLGARSVGRLNTTGQENTFVGTESGENNNNGNYNTFIGKGAGRDNVSGSSNTYLGGYAGGTNSTGSYNVAIGAAGSTGGSNNVMIGSGNSGQVCSSDFNVMIGTSAGVNTTTGSSNLFLGRYSGYQITTGSGNVCLGYTLIPNTPATATSAGYDTNNSIILATGNSGQKLYIHNNGNMGIGLGNNVIPQNKLDVKGAVAIGSGYMTTLSTAGPTAPANGLIVEGNVGVGTSAPANKLEITSSTANTSGLRFSNLNSGFDPGVTATRFLTLNATGDVIVRNLPAASGGATTDAQTLSFSGNVLSISNGNSVTLPSPGTACNLYSCDGTISTLPTDANNPNPGLRTVTMGNNNLFFNGNGSFNEETDGSGRIYIGSTMDAASFPTITSTSQFRLMVEGGVLTERVKIALRSDTANWADYVFAKDYELMPLNEVESYVKENKHLPGIESATELQEKGLDLGEMQAKQMGKIEELTLYVIDQAKQIEELKAQVKALLEKK
ncbi:MAG: hypothetical protein QM710_11425 [Flavobacterium sp.]